MWPRPTIAIVDDEPTVRRALHRLLSAADIESTPFASGAALLAVLRQWRPDGIVLDLQMPDMTGLDVLKALAARGFAIPTIVITARDEPGSREQCVANGAMSYLCKPLDETMLLSEIARAVAASRAAGGG